MQPFTGSFTQQEPIADDAIAAAVEVLRSGRLHRYNTVGDELGPVAELEKAYAAYQRSTYCLLVHPAVTRWRRRCARWAWGQVIGF